MRRTANLPLLIATLLALHVFGFGAFADDGNPPAGAPSAQGSAPSADASAGGGHSAGAAAPAASAEEAQGGPATRETANPQGPEPTQTPPTSTAGPQDTPGPVDEVRQARPSLSAEEAAREQRLRARVQERWQTMIARDFQKAYAFETPEYRASHTAEQYAAEFGGAIKWHVANIKELRYHSADEVEVVLALDVSLPLSDTSVRTTVDVPEPWIHRQGDWWRRHVQQTLPTRQPPDPSPKP